MFYLIGGTPRTGKTSLAKTLFKEIDVSWISTDTIESVVSRYVSEKDFAGLFPKSLVRRETEYSNDIMYEKYSSSEIVELYFKQAESLEQALEVFLESEARYGHSYIVEGYHITPSLTAKLQKSFKVRSVFLGREDKEDIRKSITVDTGPTNWVVGKTKKTETFDKITDMIVEFGEKVRQGAESYDQRYCSMDGDFKENSKEALAYLK